MDASDFPVIRSIPIDADRFNFPVASLRKSIEQVAVAASDDDSRPAMKGIFVELSRSNEGDVVVVCLTAADGYRLATRSFVIQDFSCDKELPFSSILAPARAFAELVRIIRDDDGLVSVYSDGDHMVCESGRVTLSSRIIGENFPDFRKIIPSEWDTQVVVEKKDLERAVKISSFFAASNQNFVRLDLRVSRDDVVITSNASEIGDTAGTVHASGTGKDGVIALNVAYFTDALKAVSTEQVVIEINDPKRPFVLTEAGGGTYKHIIMPMTLR
jgi:DNA polymerase-3 subunit beta